MLTYRNTNRFFGTLGLVFLLVHLRYVHLHWQVPAIFLFDYLLLQFYGSYFIASGFHVKAICSADTNRKRVSITFDDGPVPGITSDILDLLRENNVKAAFFCIGKNIHGNEPILRRMQDEGHVIGNHSYLHDLWFDLHSANYLEQDLLKTEKQILDVTGRKPRFFCPPYGVTTPNLRKAIDRLDYKTIGWSIRTLDTYNPGTDSVMKRIKKQIGPGSILLFHDRLPEAVTLLRAALAFLAEQGYEVVPLDELIQLKSYA